MITITIPTPYGKHDFPLRDDMLNAPQLDIHNGVTGKQLRDHLHRFTAYFFDFPIDQCPLDEGLYTLELRYWAKDKGGSMDEVKFQYLFNEPTMGLDYGFTLWAFSEVFLDSIGVDINSMTEEGKVRVKQYEELFYPGDKMISHNHCSSDHTVGDCIDWIVDLVQSHIIPLQGEIDAQW